MFGTFSSESFFNPWYWVLTVSVWTLVSHRTMGVPYDMVLRARRLPEVAAAVDRLAAIHAARTAAVARALGAPGAAAVGFVLAAMGTLGFWLDHELAQAVFMLAAPLAWVTMGTLRLGVAVKRGGVRGEKLLLWLARRRAWNQAIAIVAILSAALVALGHQRMGIIG